jgi:hypothetical protein
LLTFRSDFAKADGGEDGGAPVPSDYVFVKGCLIIKPVASQPGLVDMLISLYLG